MASWWRLTRNWKEKRKTERREGSNGRGEKLYTGGEYKKTREKVERKEITKRGFNRKTGRGKEGRKNRRTKGRKI